MARKTTKAKILHILKKDDEVTIKELLEYFTISEVAIRRHLNDLIRQKFVRERVVKQEIGRPFHTYALTTKGHETFPNQYQELPVEILRDVEELQGPEAVNDLLKRRVDRDEDEIKAKTDGASFDEKIALMADVQERKGYMIEYEKLANGQYSFKNFNCPIYNVSSNYRQICHYEKDMVRNVFPGSHVVADACMTSGDKYCCWYISQPEEKEEA